MTNFYDILKNVCTLLHEETPGAFNSTGRPYPEIKQYIKTVIDEVCSKYPWTFREKKYTFNTVVAQREYTLPSGCAAINIIKDGIRVSGVAQPLYFVLHSDLDILAQASGKPNKYSVYASKLILDPTPDAVYSVQLKYLTSNYATTSDGATEKANLELETDISIIPERFIKIAEWGAYSLHRQNFKPDSKYKLARDKFLEYLSDMKRFDGYGEDASPRVVLERANSPNLSFISDFFHA